MVGEFCTNCYVLINRPQGNCFVIDPGADAETILDILKQEKTTPCAIINTHAHIDHIGANSTIKEKTGCPIFIHQADSEGLLDNQKNLSMFVGVEKKILPADRLLRENDELAVGTERIVVVHTPGHTPGSICLLGNNYIFTGDTLFADSIGRTDLPGGDENQLYKSLKKLLETVKGDPLVLPGHAEPGYFSLIRKTNPFLDGK